MRLQSDPTIIYGLVGGKGTLGRPIMKSEIMQPSPYNTYVIDGLPPGPITNPGRASLEAAANPARTRELYFVADGTGGHVFAETYEQQQKNVARLRLIETDQKDQAPIDDQMNSPPPGQAGSAPAAPAGASAALPLRGSPKPTLPRKPLTDCRGAPDRGPSAVVTAACYGDAPPLSSARFSFTISAGGPQSMALSSMTGFARGHGVCGSYSWTWEIKSVNGKGLDLRLRLPPGWDAIEVPVRRRAAEALTRGSVQANLDGGKKRRGAGRARQHGGARGYPRGDATARTED